MADKPTTNDVSPGSQYSASTFNDNFAILEEAIEGCLGRGGTSESPNSMEGDLDMDTHNLLNVTELNGYNVSEFGESINTVADNITDINTTADNIADVNTVADDLNGTDTIGTVSGSISNVNTVGNNIANVNTVATNIADVNTVADDISAVVNVSDAIDNGDLLTDVYQGAHADDPTTRLDGSALQPGDLYFSTLNEIMRTYTGSEWINAASGLLSVETKTLASGQTSVTFVGSLLYASFYINGPDVDNGRLIITEDYSVNTETKTVTLTQSYPDGTFLSACRNEIGEFEVQAYTYTNIAALRDAYITDGAISIVRDYATEGDGGGGTFRWDNSDLSTEVTADTQSGIYVAPNNDLTGASGAWVRQYSGAVNAKWFGAVGDGVTDDTVAIQAALEYAANIYNELYLPSGTYLVTSGLTTPSPLYLRGAGIGASSIKFNCSSTFTGLSFGASTDFGRLSGIASVGFINSGVNGDYCIKTPAQADQYDTYDQKFSFEDIEIRGADFTGGGAYYPVTDQTFTEGHIFIGDCKFCQIKDIKINGGFDVISDPSGQVTDNGIVIDPISAALTVRIENLEFSALHTGIYADGAAFYSISEFDFIGVYRGITHIDGSEAKLHTGIINAQEYGIYMENAFSRSITNVDVQRLSTGWSGATNDWYGIKINDVLDAVIIGCKFQPGSAAYGGGFTNYGVYSVIGSSLNVGNCNFGTGIDVGVYLSNHTGFNIHDSMINANTPITLVYLAVNSRYGTIKGVAQSTTLVTHTMIADDGSVSDLSYQYLQEDVTGFNRLPYGGEVTIASGSITPTRSFHVVDTEGDAGTDDLDTIVAPTYFPLWIELELRPVSSSRFIVMKDNTGNLRLAGDFTMNSANDWIKLVYDGSVWKEVSRSDN